MSNTSKLWYKRTVQRLTRYQDHKRRVIMLQEELEANGPKMTGQYSLAPAYSGPGDSTGQLAGTLVDKQFELLQIEKEIRLIDKAVSMLKPEKQLIIRLKYLEENKDLYVQRFLKKEFQISSRDTYYRWKDEAVEQLAKDFGEMKGE